MTAVGFEVLNQSIAGWELGGLSSLTSIALPGDQIFISWVGASSPSSSTGIAVHGTVMTTSGEIVVPEFIVSNNIHTLKGAIALATDGGNVSIAWQSYEQDGNDNDDIYARTWNVDTQQFYGQEIRINSNTIGLQRTPSIEYLGENLITSWASNSNYLINISNPQFGTISNIDSGISVSRIDTFHPEVVPETNGSFSIIVRNSQSDIIRNSYDSTGNLLSSDYLLPNIFTKFNPLTSAFTVDNVKIATSATGEHLITWVEYTLGNGPKTLKAAWLSSSWTEISPTVSIDNLEIATSAIVKINQNGDAVIAWNHATSLPDWSVVSQAKICVISKSGDFIRSNTSLASDLPGWISGLNIASNGNVSATISQSTVDGFGLQTGVQVVQALVDLGISRAPVGIPTILGVAEQSNSFSVSVDGVIDADGIDPLTIGFQWLRDGIDVNGAVGKSFTLTETDVGSQISVRFYYTDNYGNTHSLTSEASATVANVNDAPVASSDLTVSAAENVVAGTILATASATDPDAGAVLTYSISSGNQDGLFAIDSSTGAISLAPGMSFDYETATQHVLTVTASDGLLIGTQNITINVTDANDAPTGTVVITGSTIVGQTVNVDTSGITDADGIGSFVSYAWFADGVAVVSGYGSTSNPLATQFPLTADFLGKVITVQYSYYDAAGNFETATSAGALVVDPEALNGTAEADIIDGTADTDLIRGYFSSDTINGNARNDRIYGDDGADLLLGGSGDDILYGGIGSDILKGDDVIAGNDTLDGGAGSDTLEGGAGDDLYFTDGLDSIVELNNGGIDTVESSVDFTLGDNIENLRLTGSTSINAIGNSLDNWIFGNSSGNVLSGEDGNDILFALAGNDILFGENGSDILYSDWGDDTIFGGNGSDTLRGDFGNDLLYGGADSDSLVALEGNDTLMGGDGDDSYFNGYGEELIVEDFEAGNDTVYSAFSYTLGLNVENLVITEDAQVLDEYIVGMGNSLSNLLVGYIRNDSLDGGAGNDTLDGGIGNDTLIGGAGDDSLYGGGGDDLLIAGSGQNFVDGGDGNDTFVFQYEGNTTVSDAAGGNWLRVERPADTLFFSRLYYNAQGGLVLEGMNGSSITVNDPATLLGIQWSTFTPDNVYSTYSMPLQDLVIGTLGNDVLSTLTSAYVEAYGADGDDQITILAGSSWVTGDGGSDVVFGGLGNDAIHGDFTYPDTGNDTLYGGGGNDVLWGEAGQDVLDGGEGDDLLFGDDGDDSLNGGSGNDTLNGGNGSDSLFGGSGDDYLQGDTGNDLLVGGDGSNTLDGGDGDDVYFVQSDIAAQNTVVDEGGTYDVLRVADTAARDAFRLVFTGTSLVHETMQGHVTTTSITSGVPTVEYLQWVGGPEYGTPAYTNTLRIVTDLSNISGRLIAVAATDSADVIVLPNEQPLEGEYWGEVYANSGDDAVTLSSTFQYITYGGDGNDTISGVGGIDDYITGDAGNDLLSGSGGADTIDSGNGDDVLYGGDGDDHLYGGAGNDTINDGVGIDIIDGGDGIDTFIRQYDGIDYSIVLAYDLAQGSAYSPLTPDTAAEYFSGIENMSVKGGYTFFVAGDVFDNVLETDAGNDTLNGAGGADTLIGGAGNDTYLTDGFDTVTEGVNAGTDTVQSSASYTLGTNLENLTLTGSAAINGTGNTLNNVVTGNSGNNTLNGGAGTDTLIGGAGNDTYVTDGGDTITEGANGGTDTVQSSVTYTLGENLENLSLSGSAAINGTGNTLNNAITGNSGNNSLNGAAGNDTLNGGTGTDTLVGGTGSDTYITDGGDTITETANAGIDTVESSVTYTLGTNVENLTLTGSASINGTGNALNNVVTGNSGNNTLNGGAGTDTLIGSDGNDIYVTNGGDTIIEAANAGTDTVQSSVTYTLADNLENLTLTGNAAINGSGNALANVLVGNTEANTLVGGGGADIITGGAGRDILTGGLDNDTFVFRTISESGTATRSIDLITDFVQGQDKIDLSQIDAFTGGTANDTFVWRGTSAFQSTTSGEVRYQLFDNAGTTNDYTQIYLDNDRDTGIESTIQLTGLHMLTEWDFIL